MDLCLRTQRGDSVQKQLYAAGIGPRNDSGLTRIEDAYASNRHPDWKLEFDAGRPWLCIPDTSPDWTTWRYR